MRMIAFTPTPVKPYLKPRPASNRPFGQGILPERLNAGQWSRAICGKLWSVASPEQQRRAVAMLGTNSPDWRTIEPPAPTLDELAARLAEKNAERYKQPEPADVVQESEAPTLTIKGIRYRVETIDAGEDAAAAVRLRKLSGQGEVYDVQRTHHGLVECDCPDYELRRKGHTAEPCKHGVACVEAGLLVAASPKVETPARRGRFVPSALDCEWAAATSPYAGLDYEVLAVNPPALCGGSPADDGPESWGPETDAWVWNLGPDPELDVDELLAGMLGEPDHGDAQNRTLIGHPAQLD